MPNRIKLPGLTVLLASRHAMTTLAVLMLAPFLGLADAAELTTKKNSADSRLFAKLSTPMTSIVDGRSFREGITRIADSAGVNIWIDRHVDPSRLIDSGQLGPTSFMALKQLASDHGCVVMPIRSVLLIGKEAWVDRVAASLVSTKPSKRVDVAWPRLTTPDQARQMVQVSTESKPLPHDLWPAVQWKEIEPSVAEALIVAQFEHNEPIADRDQRRMAKLRSVYDRKLSKAAENVKATDPLESTFSLTTQTSAAAVLTQLCAAANLKCVIANDSSDRCQKIVSIRETDVSLRQLIETVAEKAGVIPRWEADQVVFKPSPSSNL